MRADSSRNARKSNFARWALPILKQDTLPSFSPPLQKGKKETHSSRKEQRETIFRGTQSANEASLGSKQRRFLALARLRPCPSWCAGGPPSEPSAEFFLSFRLHTRLDATLPFRWPDPPSPYVITIYMNPTGARPFPQKANSYKLKKNEKRGRWKGPVDRGGGALLNLCSLGQKNLSASRASRPLTPSLFVVGRRPPISSVVSYRSLRRSPLLCPRTSGGCPHLEHGGEETRVPAQYGRRYPAYFLFNVSSHPVGRLPPRRSRFLVKL